MIRLERTGAEDLEDVIAIQIASFKASDKDTKISSFLYLLNELISSEKDCKIFDIICRMD